MIFWLVCKNRMRTKDRLRRWGLLDDTTALVFCVVLRKKVETICSLSVVLLKVFRDRFIEGNSRVIGTGRAVASKRRLMKLLEDIKGLLRVIPGVIKITNLHKQVSALNRFVHKSSKSLQNLSLFVQLLTVFVQFQLVVNLGSAK